MKIAKGHQAVMPYLILKGASKFIEFAKNVFNAVETHRTFREDENTIAHAEIMIDECTIMLADATAQHAPANSGFFVYVEDTDKSYQRALDNGATTVSEISNQDYGRTCGVKDPFGNTWWITSLEK